MNDRWHERDRWGGRGYGDEEDEYQRRREAYRETRDYWRNSEPRYGDRQVGRDSGYDRDRGYNRYSGSGDNWNDDANRQHERGWWDRTKDEVRSWMGDSDAGHRREADHERGHRGRGPKGYTRTDDRIRDDINDRLMEDWGVDATDIEVSVAAGEVTLSGSVDGRDSKRRAEDLAADVLGVKDVQNNLRVRRIDPFASSREVGAGSQTGTQTGTGTTAASTAPPASLGSTITPTPRH